MGVLRQYSQRPYDDAIGDQTGNFLDWVQTTLNTLVGQQLSGKGFSALSNPTVDPTTSQIKSLGGRVSSLTTGSAFTATTTSISIFWDGTNSSTLLRIYRDDGSVTGPFSGNVTITGLSANTPYFFYPYFDETAQVVTFVAQSGAVGSPPIAYSATSILVAQSQILRGRLPLWGNLSVNGITTPAAGSTPGTKLGGGGGGVGIYLAKSL